MPHVIIEYSANVAEHHDIDDLVTVVHETALDQEFAALDALRTRAEERTHYLVADGAPTNAFIAIHVRVGPGRDQRAKDGFLHAALDAAARLLADGPLDIAWSMEITEIDPMTRINHNHVRPAVSRRLQEEEGA